MDPLSPLPAVCALVVALITCLFLRRYTGEPAAGGRYLAIDGLRGYLAFAVFLHHSAMWFSFARTGAWIDPASQLYEHFGETGVTLFFMITAFLFTSKILDARKSGVDWLKLYVSRVLRLVPLYTFVILLMLLIVVILSEGELRNPPALLARQILKWFTFTLFGEANINGIPHTELIIAGVTWSLPYEWYFYGLLPLLGLVFGVRVSWHFVALAIAVLLFVIWRGTNGQHWFSFLGGIIAALLLRMENIAQHLRGRPFSLLAILAIGTVVLWYPSPHAPVPLFLITAAFTIVAAGNGVFGLFTHPLSRILGEMAYGIYLLHGMFLFVLFRFVFGSEQASQLSPEAHWAAVIAITPLLIWVAHLCYTWIEHPALSKTATVTAWMREKVKQP